jgi:hypothetical protein
LTIGEFVTAVFFLGGIGGIVQLAIYSRCCFRVNSGPGIHQVEKNLEGVMLTGQSESPVLTLLTLENTNDFTVSLKAVSVSWSSKRPEQVQWIKVLKSKEKVEIDNPFDTVNRIYIQNWHGMEMAIIENPFHANKFTPTEYK